MHTLQASAGTLESNDILITITPGSGSEQGNDIELDSIVLRQFGPAILATIRESLEQGGLTGVRVSARDRGALDCTIRARMETAIERYRLVQEPARGEGA